MNFNSWENNNNLEVSIKIFVALGLVALLTGCATASKDITSTYTSPVQYQQFNCSQLAAETQRIQSRVSELGGRLDQAATHDKEIAAGGVLFWPVLFALGGTKQQEADYARLKGEYDAVQQEAISKNCAGIVATPKVTAQQAAPQIKPETTTK